MPYVNMPFLQRRVGQIVAGHGETMTLRRTGEVDIALKGKRIPGTTEETGGTAVQQVFRVKIGIAELQASSWTSKVPVRGDAIVIAGRTRVVLDVRPLSDGDSVILYELRVAG